MELMVYELFLPEKAVVLSQMGQHKAALEIYVFKLKDYSKAERYNSRFSDVYSSYCIRIYSKADLATVPSRKESALQVFHTLLTLYLTAKPTLLLPALEILAKHSPRLDAAQALSLIPSET